MATSAQARKTVFGALAGTALIAAVEDVAGGDLPAPTILVGAVVAAAGLSALAGPAPNVAAGLALIALVASAIIAGPDVFRLPFLTGD